MKQDKNGVNSWDIARLAGVSRSTVSRVVNNYPNVPEETREKVMAFVKQYNYYPHFSGQVLSGKGTGTIGLFWVLHGSIMPDPLASSFMVGVIEDAAEMDFLVLACVVPNLTDAVNIERVKRVFLQGRVDGGIFIGAANNEPLIEELIASGRPVGLFDQYMPGHEEKNRFIVNFEKTTGEKAIDYLVSLGHQRIAVIDGDLNRYSSFCRHESMLNALRKHSIEIRGEWMKMIGRHAADSYELAMDIVSRGDDLPTAICCTNDSAAFHAVSAVRDAGLNVPGDISVTGIDDHVMSSSFKPPLTTFRFEFPEMLLWLTRRLITGITDPDSEEERIKEFYSTLMERESCGKAH
jgi:LacI family transcriptional regulator